MGGLMGVRDAAGAHMNVSVRRHHVVSESATMCTRHLQSASIGTWWGRHVLIIPCSRGIEKTENVVLKQAYQSILPYSYNTEGLVEATIPAPRRKAWWRLRSPHPVGRPGGGYDPRTPVGRPGGGYDPCTPVGRPVEATMPLSVGNVYVII
uniref:Uncharacterized protein n=1 Tax=Branchiostoma floridae TaxID=7739 RepID=C3YGT5_BRAFL|eukprot:XP_002604395.1 hypothetical protein BRAFLDRAFT_79302 [Branchiostoma floridae]